MRETTSSATLPRRRSATNTLLSCARLAATVPVGGLAPPMGASNRRCSDRVGDGSERVDGRRGPGPSVDGLVRGPLDRADVGSKVKVVSENDPTTGPELAVAPAGDRVPRQLRPHAARLYNRSHERPRNLQPPAARERARQVVRARLPRARALQARLREMEGERIHIPLVIGGKDVHTGETFEAVMPHRTSHVLADVNKGGAGARRSRRSTPPAQAHADWSRTPWEERAAIFLRAAELLAGPWRRRSTPRPCSASRRPRTRPRSTPPAS